MSQSPVRVIVEVVADERGVDPYELDISLQEYIEVDAIELLAAHESASWTLTCELPKHDVTIRGEGEVHVDGERKAMWV